MRNTIAIDSCELVDASEHRGSRSWALLLSVSLVLIVCIRFFSENLGILPGIVQFVDVPLTGLVLLGGILGFVRRGLGPDALRLRAIIYLFVLISLIACLANSSRVQLYPTAMFIYGFAAPLAFAAVTINGRVSREDVRLVVRFFFFLGVLQLAVGLFYGLPQLIVTGNPDYVSGTFGRNCYQFTYFLGLWLLYLLGGAVVKSDARRRGAGVAIVVAAVAVFVLFYAAQYRAMLIFFTLVILVTLWASPARMSKRVLHTIMVAAVSVITLIAVGTAYPNLKLLQVFDLFKDTSPIVQSGKVQVANNVLEMYEDMPHTAMIGSGPATFSSRGYITFSAEPDPRKDTAGPLAVSLMGGKQYGTDVARRYVESINSEPIQGGTTASSPRSSYTSLAAEVGLAGLFVYLAAYVSALIFSYRRLQASARANDALGVKLAFTCFGGLLLLLIQALFDNWLETTRVAIPLWTLIGLLYALKDAGAPEPLGATVPEQSEQPVVSR